MAIGRKHAAALALLALLVACTGTQSSAAPIASDENVGAQASPSASGPANATDEQVFRDFIAAINSGETADAAAFLSPDARLFGESIAFTGPEAALSLFVCAADIVSVEADGDELVVELEYTGTAPLATEECEEPGSRGHVHRVTIQDGLITSLTTAGPE